MAKQHLVCKTAELPSGARKIVNVGSRSIGVFNLDGQYYALMNLCPHQGAKLCEGPICGTNVQIDNGENYYNYAHKSELIRCSRHGWEFRIRDGTNFDNPNMKVKTYPVSVEDDQVILHL